MKERWPHREETHTRSFADLNETCTEVWFDCLITRHLVILADDGTEDSQSFDLATFVGAARALSRQRALRSHKFTF